MRRGFTLIETVMALVILEFAMLAVAASTLVAARNFSIAHRAAVAQSLARNRLETLTATACSGSTSGSRAVEGGYVEQWAVEGPPTRPRLTVRVEYAPSATRRTQVTLSTSAWCAP